MNQETRSFVGFVGMQFRAVGKIILTQGESENLTIQADAEMLERIHTEIHDGILVISYDSDWRDWTGLNLIDKGMTIYQLNMKKINSLSISGVGYLDAASITTDTLSLSLSGPATMTIGTLSVGTLKVEMSGVGSIDVAGKCVEQELTLSGAGNYKAPRLESDKTSVKISGVGNAIIWARNSLEAVISGAGGVEYYGKPQISQKLTGLGVLKYLGDR